MKAEIAAILKVLQLRDISALDVLRDPSIRIQKEAHEKAAIENIKNALRNTNGQEIYDLFYEFEHKETYEAKVANALDKLEVQLQHNHANISTWEEIEYDMSYMMDKHVLFDETLTELKDQIEAEAELKMAQAGVDIKAVRRRVGK